MNRPIIKLNRFQLDRRDISKWACIGEKRDGKVIRPVVTYGQTPVEAYRRWDEYPSCVRWDMAHR